MKPRLVRSPWSPGAPGARERSREVERSLEAHGLGPRELPSGGEPPEGFGARLALALPPLGPAFAAFAAWLGGRIDLLGIAECAPLADLADELAPEREADPLAGAADLDRDLDIASDLEVDARPVAASPFFLLHRAAGRDGRPLLLRRVRPGLLSAVERDLPALRELVERLAPALPRGASAVEIAADFESDLCHRLDLGRAAEALAALPETPGVEIARVVPEISSPRLLAVEAPPRPSDLAALKPVSRDALARRLARLALGEMFAGRLPLEAAVAATPGGALSISYLRAAAMPVAARDGLREIVEATAAHDPERAAAALLCELAAAPDARADAAHDFAKRLRQLVPRHEPSLSPAGESLAEHLLAAAPLARRCRLRPSPPLASFWRGLAFAARAARRLSGSCDPLRDPLREALEDLRWQGGFDRMRQLADPERLGAALETYLSAMAALPQRIERALDAAAHPAETAPRESRSANDSAAAIALGLAMVAVAIAGGALGPAAAAPLPEPFCAAAFLLLGGWLLRILWSRR